MQNKKIVLLRLQNKSWNPNLGFGAQRMKKKILVGMGTYFYFDRYWVRLNEGHFKQT